MPYERLSSREKVLVLQARAMTRGYSACILEIKYFLFFFYKRDMFKDDKRIE